MTGKNPANAQVRAAPSAAAAWQRPLNGQQPNQTVRNVVNATDASNPYCRSHSRVSYRVERRAGPRAARLALALVVSHTSHTGTKAAFSHSFKHCGG